MAATALPALFLLLHDGGWDEVLMVAAGLIIAYVVIVWTGRRKGDDEEEEALDLLDEQAASDPVDGPAQDKSPRRGR
jgi:hypothetical protein